MLKNISIYKLKLNFNILHFNICTLYVPLTPQRGYLYVLGPALGRNGQFSASEYSKATIGTHELYYTFKLLQTLPNCSIVVMYRSKYIDTLQVVLR